MFARSENINKLLILILLLGFWVSSYGQTASSPWQAKYATGGTGGHVGEICWLTWGTSGNAVANGTYYWNLTPSIQAVATITGVTSDGNNTNPLVAYNAGTYSGDGLQLLYSGVNPIGLSDRIYGDGISFNISIRLLVNGVSASYPGMVIGDAESMATGEYITAETNGTGWQVLDFRNAAPASTQADYKLVVSNLQKKFTIQSVNSSNQGMQAVLFAQGASSLNNVKLKGGGLTALAIGLIVPVDFGDAPASYGSAGHYINGFTPTGTTITNGTFSVVNIIKSNLVPSADVYLGSANIDADDDHAGIMANADDTSGADDENGVTFTGGPLKVNQTGNYSVAVTVTNSSSRNATIYGWIDFNVDGIFSPNELATAAVAAGTITPVTVSLTYNLDNYTSAAGTFRAGTSYGRFRITTDNLVNTNTGLTVDQRSRSIASDGEVEDYRIDITALSIRGTVYNDANGLTDSLVNGAPAGNLSQTPLYVYLSRGGIITAKTAVAANGQYAFTNINPGGSYTVTLATDGSQLPGASLSAVASSLPSGWLHTGVTYGSNNLYGSGISSAPATGTMTISFNDQNTDVSGIDFGTERPPVNPKLSYIIAQPPLHSSLTLTTGNSMGPLGATDPEDGGLGTAQTLVITSLAGMNGNQLFYNNVLLSAGAVISSYDPSLLRVVFENLASDSAGFQFSFRDAAGKYSDSPGQYNLAWLAVLPLTLLDFTATRTQEGVKLSWITTAEESVSNFDVQYSADGQTWKSIGRLNSSQQGGDKYSWTDAMIHNGTSAFYRLKLNDRDGRFIYSPVRLVSVPSGNNIQCYPNPTKSRVYLVATGGGVTGVDVLSLSGGVVLSQKGSNIHEINLEPFSRGCYIIRMFREGKMIASVPVVRQ